MKKELVVEMDAECIDCPHLSLITRRPYHEARIAIHVCEHLEFCKAVRKNWENHLREIVQEVTGGELNDGDTR